MRDLDYQLVVDALYDVNLQPKDEDYERGCSGYVNIRNDYSGRAMYGDRCFGIDFDEHRDVYAFVASMTVKLMRAEDEYNEDHEALAQPPEDPTQWALETRTDGMGLGIIAYWPGYRLVNIPDDADVSELADA